MQDDWRRLTAVILSRGPYLFFHFSGALGRVNQERLELSHLRFTLSQLLLYLVIRRHLMLILAVNSCYCLARETDLVFDPHSQRLDLTD